LIIAGNEFFGFVPPLLALVAGFLLARRRVPTADAKWLVDFLKAMLQCLVLALAVYGCFLNYILLFSGPSAFGRWDGIVQLFSLVLSVLTGAFGYFVGWFFKGMSS